LVYRIKLKTFKVYDGIQLSGPCLSHNYFTVDTAASDNFETTKVTRLHDQTLLALQGKKVSQHSLLNQSCKKSTNHLSIET